MYLEEDYYSGLVIKTKNGEWVVIYDVEDDLINGYTESGEDVLIIEENIACKIGDRNNNFTTLSDERFLDEVVAFIDKFIPQD